MVPPAALSVAASAAVASVPVVWFIVTITPTRGSPVVALVAVSVVVGEAVAALAAAAYNEVAVSTAAAPTVTRRTARSESPGKGCSSGRSRRIHRHRPDRHRTTT